MYIYYIVEKKKMINVNVTNFRKDMFNYFDQVIKYNQPISVTTKEGDAVLLSGDDYRGLMETLYIESIPGLKEQILESINSPRSEFIDTTDMTIDEIIALAEKDD